MKNKIVLYTGLGIISLIIIFLLYFNYLIGTTPVDKEVIFEVRKGQSTEQIIDELNKIGYLQPKSLYYYFIGFIKIKDNSFLQAGYYKFPAKISNYEIINSLLEGKNLYSIKVTLPEGMNIYEYASIFKNKLNIDSTEFVNMAMNTEFLQKHNIQAISAEGYIFPSTYQFIPNVSANKILSTLINEQTNRWKESYDQQASVLGYNKHQILTLASIIEAETTVADERAKVSGLYHNRLRKGMLLQADPTVQYAIGRKERVLKSDLRINNPYNTYLYTGLPPGPINNPSINSIIATLYPEEHNYLFMVAKNDGSGLHNFAENYRDHLKFVNQFRQSRRNQ